MSTQPNPEFVRFRDVSTDLLYDAKMMNDGVIVRQCYPNDWNVFFCTFDEFVNRFEVSDCQPNEDAE